MLKLLPADLNPKLREQLTAAIAGSPAESPAARPQSRPTPSPGVLLSKVPDWHTAQMCCECTCMGMLRCREHVRPAGQLCADGAAASTPLIVWLCCRPAKAAHARWRRARGLSISRCVPPPALAELQPCGWGW